MDQLRQVLDRDERAVDQRLVPISQKHGARVFSKMRIADVINLDARHLTRRHREYGLMAHFDFVVADAALRPHFAIEFDGASHLKPIQQARDAIKDAICKQFGLPLLRINSHYIVKKYRKFDLLTWIVDVWFLQTAFNEAQADGHIPSDELFDPITFFNVPGHAGCFPLWLTRDLTGEFQRLYAARHLYDPGPSFVIIRTPSGAVRALGFMRVTADGCVLAQTGMRRQHFDLPLDDLLGEIVCFEVRYALQLVLDRQSEPIPAATAHEQIDRFVKTGEVLTAHYYRQRTAPDLWKYCP